MKNTIQSRLEATDWTIKTTVPVHGNDLFVIVRRDHADGLNAEEFSFRLVSSLPVRLALTSYDLLARPTKRHAFRPTAHLNAFDKRDSTIEVEDIPLTDEVRDAARRALADYITTIPVWRDLRTA